MSTPGAWAVRQKVGSKNGAKQLRADGSTSESRLLTFRELQVLEWIAAGKRDREIGKILNISSRTTQKHVEHILDKLGVETRGAAAAWWYNNRT